MIKSWLAAGVQMKLIGFLAFVAFWVAISISMKDEQRERRAAGYNPIQAGATAAREDALHDAQTERAIAILQYEAAKNIQVQGSGALARGAEVAKQEAIQEARARLTDSQHEVARLKSKLRLDSEREGDRPPVSGWIGQPIDGPTPSWMSPEVGSTRLEQ